MTTINILFYDDFYVNINSKQIICEDKGQIYLYLPKDKQRQKIYHYRILFLNEKLHYIFKHWCAPNIYYCIFKNINIDNYESTKRLEIYPIIKFENYNIYFSNSYYRYIIMKFSKKIQKSYNNFIFIRNNEIFCNYKKFNTMCNYKCVGFI